MKKIREKLKGLSTLQKNPESMIYVQIKKRRGSTQRVMFTEKTEEMESERQLQHFLIAPDTSAISILTRPLKKMSVSIQHQNKCDSFVEKDPHINGYLASKLKKFMERKQEITQTKSTYRSSISPQQNKSMSCDPSQNESYMTCDTCCRISRKHTFDEGSFLKNAKQRILRLMELKLVKQKEEELLSQHITKRCLKTEKSKRGVPCAYKMSGLEDEAWDKEWKSSLSLELKRYRNRIINKSKKSQINKINLPFS